MAKDDYSVQPAENTELYTKKIEEQEIKIKLTEEDYELVKKYMLQVILKTFS